MSDHLSPLLCILSSSILLVACDSSLEDAGSNAGKVVISAPDDPSPSFEQPDWQTLDHADYLVDDPGVETRRIPDPDSYDDDYWMLRWEDPDTDALAPNFAGRFVALVHGCGTNCKFISFIDLESGVHRRDLEIQFSCGLSEEGSVNYTNRIECDVRSRLLIVPCRGSSVGREGYHYYEFEDDELRLVRVDLWDTSWNGDLESTPDDASPEAS